MSTPADNQFPELAGASSGVYQRLRRAREETGLTQSQVAEFTGLPRSSLAEIEAGAKPAEGGIISRIALLLGVDPAWLSGHGKRVARHRIDIETGLIDRAVRAHLLWRATILADLDARRVPGTPLIDDEVNCDLGRWLAGNDAMLRRHPLHAELLEAHRDAHRTGRLLRTVARAQRFEEAAEMMRSGEPFRASLRLVSLLNRLRPDHADSGRLDGERSFPVWSSRYVMGHPLIDAQHEELFHRTADIHMAVLRREGDAAIRRMIGFLVEYAERHFRAEEALMELAGCPGLDHHRQRHRALAATVAHLDRRLQASEDVPLLELCWFLADWLSDHIISEDLPNAAAVRAAVAAGRIPRSGD